MKSENLEKKILNENTRQSFRKNKQEKKLKNFLTDAKLYLNRFIYPAAFLTATNMAYLWGADQTLDFVSRELEKGNGIASAGAYTLLTAGLIAANIGVKIKNKRIGLLPVAKSIYSKNKKEFDKRREALKRNPYERQSKKEKNRNITDWVKTGIMSAALLFGYVQSDMNSALERFRFDGQRLGNGAKAFVQSFARKDYSLENEDDKTKAENKAEQRKNNTEITLKITAPINSVNLPEKGPFKVPPYLQGKKISDMLSLYTGIIGEAGAEFNPDFSFQLGLMWDRKTEWVSKNIKGQKAKTINAELDRAKQELVGYYKNLKKPTRITLEDYIKEADNAINTIKQNINWDVVAEQRKLGKERIWLVKELAEKITGKDLITYGLTELMPNASDGLMNKLILDMLLRSAGREYVESIPSMFDDKISIGLYQFTSQAVYDDGDDGSEKRGASLINTALPQQYRIPGSVMKLKGNDHHKAAYLFAINNLAELVKNLKRNEFEILAMKYDEKEEDLVKFIATAHHLPSSAISAARRWIINGCKGDYSLSCTKAIRNYSGKTTTNYVAMQAQTSFDSTERIRLPEKTIFAYTTNYKEFTEKNNEEKKKKEANSYTVTVRKGHTLYRIAQENKTSVEKLKQWNNLYDNNIKPGQQLRIYGNK